MAVVCVYIRADICLSTEVLSTLYDVGMYLHMCRYMPLYKGIEYIICMWYVCTYVPIFDSLCIRDWYVIWLWYVSTNVPIYASLHTWLVCHMAVVCVYILADTYLSSEVLSILYGYGMCLHT